MRPGIAGQMLLNFAPGYCAEISDFLPEKMSTRLAEESITLWLAKVVDDVLIPYAPGEHPWEMSALRVRKSWWEKHNGEFERLEGESFHRWCVEQHQNKGFCHCDCGIGLSCMRLLSDRRADREDGGVNKSLYEKFFATNKLLASRSFQRRLDGQDGSRRSGG
ncbi:CRISPR-associated helicase Cas3 protein [Salmonella bongori]|nr:CRISPR-associated helicase Cas3 protein [Salmonella bongori]